MVYMALKKQEKTGTLSKRIIANTQTYEQHLRNVKVPFLPKTAQTHHKQAPAFISSAQWLQSALNHQFQSCNTSTHATFVDVSYGFEPFLLCWVWPEGVYTLCIYFHVSDLHMYVDIYPNTYTYSNVINELSNICEFRRLKRVRAARFHHAAPTYPQACSAFDLLGAPRRNHFRNRHCEQVPCCPSFARIACSCIAYVSSLHVRCACLGCPILAFCEQVDEHVG